MYLRSNDVAKVLRWDSSQSEAEIPHKRASIARRQFPLRPKKIAPTAAILVQHFQNILNLSRNFPDYLESFRFIWKVYGLSGKFPAYLKSFPDCLESFRYICKVPSLSGKFPVYLESLWIIWKVSDYLVGFPYFLEKFLNFLESFPDYLKC